MRQDGYEMGPLEAGMPVVTVREIVHVSALVPPHRARRPAISAGMPGIVLEEVNDVFVKVSFFDGQGDRIVNRRDLDRTTSQEAARRTAPDHRVNAIIELLL